ncbi:SDR family oxidoreductase [Halodesulfurarchaeum sp.]|uniref:SDR family oxidoreductase n=1 Tax=Halodesulfurarchaeum sp. TaxID=1980530 RepID=UPI001BBE0C4C|nr:SDR family oxidoreductase [Halodesulfurarchaeum sp.]
MKGRILVTGATGTVGSTVVHVLEDETATVRIASRRPEEAKDAFSADVESVAFSVTEPETWGQTLDGVDAIFLMLPPGTGVDPIREFVDAAARVGVEHVTFLSILGAETVPVLPHRRIERHLAAAAVEFTFLRAAYFAQNLLDIHRPEIVERDEIFVPAGDGAMGIIDARDVGQVAATALVEPEHRNRAYTLTGPESVSFHELARVASDVLERQVRYADPSVVQFARRMYARGIAPGLIAFMIAEYTVTRLGWASRTSDTVQNILGREPSTLRKFLEDHRVDLQAE